MKRILMMVVLAVSMMGVNSAIADTVSCHGIISEITYGVGGETYIKTSYRSDWTRLCSVEYEWQDAVGEKTCAVWTRAMNDAYLNGKEITVKYENITDTCGTLPTWGNSHVPTYVRVR